MKIRSPNSAHEHSLCAFLFPRTTPEMSVQLFLCPLLQLKKRFAPAQAGERNECGIFFTVIRRQDNRLAGSDNRDDYLFGGLL